MNNIFDPQFNGMPGGEGYRASVYPELYPDQKLPVLSNWDPEDLEAYCGGQYTKGLATTTAQVLIEALELLKAEGRDHSGYLYNRDTGCYCSLGAIYAVEEDIRGDRVQDEDFHDTPAVVALAEAIREIAPYIGEKFDNNSPQGLYEMVYLLNDNEGRSDDKVFAAFELAIAKIEKRLV